MKDNQIGLSTKIKFCVLLPVIYRIKQSVKSNRVFSLALFIRKRDYEFTLKKEHFTLQIPIWRPIFSCTCTKICTKSKPKIVRAINGVSTKKRWHFANPALAIRIICTAYLLLSAQNVNDLHLHLKIQHN